MPRRSRNAAFAAWLLTITRLRAHTDRACQGLQMEDCEARAGVWTHLRIEMGWGGVLVGCGSCSSIGVTGTVQMRASGSVRSIMPARRILFVGCLEMALRECACGEFITVRRGKGPIPQIRSPTPQVKIKGNYLSILGLCKMPQKTLHCTFQSLPNSSAQKADGSSVAWSRGAASEFRRVYTTRAVGKVQSSLQHFVRNPS